MTEEMEKAIMDKLILGLVEKAIERIESIKPWEKENFIKRTTLGKESAAKYIGVSPSTLNKLNIPRIYPNGEGQGRIVLYRTTTIDKWLKEKERESIKTLDDFVNEEIGESELKVI
jgi:hypothetical protein